MHPGNTGARITLKVPVGNYLWRAKVKARTSWAL
jgi:hypothetical protein